MPNTPEGQQVDKVIHALRKPEVRSDFTNAVLVGVHQYFGEMLHQGSPPSLIQQFNERRGIIFPVGSLLRGTARVGSDFDSVLLYDELESDYSGRDFEGLTWESEKFHPSGIPFRYWLARHFKEDSQLVKFYDDTRAYWQERTRRSNEYRTARGLLLNTFEEQDIERRFIVTESLVFNTEALAATLQALCANTLEELTKNRDYGEMGIYVPQILTTNSDYVVESQEGSLLHHQRRIVRILAESEQQNPEVFQLIYEYLASNFHAAVNFQSENHPHWGSTDDQTRQYLIKSGRFSEDKIERAMRVLDKIKRRIKFPSFPALIDKYLVEVNK